MTLLRSADRRSAKRQTRKVYLDGQPDVSASPATNAYPTDSRERQKDKEKLNKEAGIENFVVKKKKIVEDHHDDCGNSIDSIVTNLDTFHMWDDEESASDSDDENDILDNIQLHLFRGGDSLWEGDIASRIHTVSLSSTQELLAVLTRVKGKIDIAEVCGGEARTSQVAVRRRLTSGRNFDLVSGCDLTVDKDCYYAMQYFIRNEVLCAVMSPICGPFGPLGYLNKSINPDTWQRFADIATPVAKFCGRVACCQLRKILSFIQEQPYPSTLYEVHPWPDVMKNTRFDQVVYDRCRCGLKVEQGQYKGMVIKKASTMTASDPELLEPFRDLRCSDAHRAKKEHLCMDGHSKELRAAQLWTWQEADRICHGISELLAAQRKQSFPVAGRAPAIDPATVAAPSPGGVAGSPPDDRAHPRLGNPCKGCKSYRSRQDWTHNRVVHECWYPYDKAFIHTCSACIRRRKDDDPTHTNDEGCRKSGVEIPRATGPRVGAEGERSIPAPEGSPQPRQGHHPRDPAQPASASDSVSDLRGAPTSGTELGSSAEA